MRPQRLLVPLTLVLAAGGAMAATPARATFAGRNGRIAFEHFTSRSPSQITTVSPTGRNAHVLTDFKRGAVAPAFSPRGGRIAFTALGTPKIPDRLLTMRTGGAGVKNLTRDCSGKCLGDAEAAWSPDGRQIAFNRAYGPIVDDTADHVDLMVMNRNGTHRRLLFGGTHNNKRQLEPSVQSWSPDGEQLAVLMQQVHAERLTSAIFTMDLDSKKLRQITPWRLNAGNADYSPDGRRILFNSHFEGQKHSSIYTVNTNGNDRRRLNHPHKRYTFDPHYSPSGNRIVYVVAGRGTTIHLAKMGVGGAHRKRVTKKTLRGVSPTWGARP